MVGVGTSISGCRAPPSTSHFFSTTFLALDINKKYLNQKKRSTASQLPYSPASLTLSSAITSHWADVQVILLIDASRPHELLRAKSRNGDRDNKRMCHVCMWRPTPWTISPYCGQLTTDCSSAAWKRKPRNDYHIMSS